MSSRLDVVGEWLEADVAKSLEWMRRAACKGKWAQADFFPADGFKAGKAKQWCLVCPVRNECLADALGRHEREGVWGGTTEKERRPLLRRVAAGEPIAQVLASADPKAKLPWVPRTLSSRRYAEALVRRALMASTA